MLTPWLTSDQLKTYIGDFPDSFDPETKLGAFITNNEQGWLKQLIGPALIAELRAALSVTPLILTPRQSEFVAEIRPFLAFSAWSDYVSTGGFQITKSGLRLLSSREAEPVSEDDKNRLIRLYHGYAKQYALNIDIVSKKYLTPESCGVSNSVGSGRPIATVIKAPNRSRFNNF